LAGLDIDPANLLLAATLFANRCVSPFASGLDHSRHFGCTAAVSDLPPSLTADFAYARIFASTPCAGS
jgi:hypothetical protein